MIEYITKRLRAYKERSRLAEIKRLRETFRVKERNGSLWIMHNDTAINMVPPFASSEEVVRMLEETRCCAVEYAYGIYTEHKEEDARVIDNPFYVKQDLEGGTPV